MKTLHFILPQIDETCFFILFGQKKISLAKPVRSRKINFLRLRMEVIP